MNLDILNRLKSVVDEEERSLGTIDLIEKGIKADAAIVGEPSKWNPILSLENHL